MREALPADLSGLVIEVTEQEALTDGDLLAKAIEDLRRRGARVALDDAGAGHAGLQQLMSLRPDIVKLDRALIDGIHADSPRMALVESFVRFAAQIGATVCAEGIESLDDLVALSDLDVDWGQGFALGRPGSPWQPVAPVAAEVCRTALAQVLRSSSHESPEEITAGDRGLERLSSALADARSGAELEQSLALIADELKADKICLSIWHPSDGTVETLAESGEGSGETVFEVAHFPLTARVLEAKQVVQVMVEDPNSEPGEAELLLDLGHRSLLMVPVIHRGESIGLIEAYSDADRPWTRAEINRARIISNQFASAIVGFRNASRR